MYIFKNYERAKVLQGRTITYLAEKKLHITVAYLCSILNGQRGCSKKLAYDITHCISWTADMNDYFEKRG